MSSEAPTAPVEKASRLRALTAELRALEARLRAGGGPERIKKQHEQGKLTARERVELLLDSGSYSQEIGLLVAYDQYDGAAPAAGVVTTVGLVGGREVVVVANGATVKTIDNETLGGARTHTEVSGVAHYREESDESCIEKIREIVSELPSSERAPVSIAESRESARTPEDLYEIIPEDHRQPYDARELLACLLDEGHLDEFQADYAREMITGHARVRGLQ